MKFAVYHPWVYLTSGLERTFLELFRRSRHEWVLYTHHYEPEATYPGFADFDVVELRPRISVRRSLIPLARAATTIARTRLPDDGAAALLVSSEGLGDFIVAREQRPSICYCHTPLKILHDPQTRTALREQSPAKAAALSVLGPPFALADRRMWRRYRHVFANSRETRARIGTARLRDPADVEVVVPGVDLDRFMVSERRPGRQLLVAGRIMWQKNVELAIETVRHLAAAGVDAPLIVAGAVDAKSRPYLARLRQLAAGLPVQFEPDPSDERLAELYRSSAATLFTARNEDFGLVPLESMASGTPVVAVNVGGPTETVADGVTGWLVPAEPAAFAARGREVLDGGPSTVRMRAAARAHAERFSWQPIVDRFDDVAEQVARQVSAPIRGSATSR